MNILSTQYTLANKSFEIYLAGCNAQPKCQGCFSPETWNFDQGEELTLQKLNEIVSKIREFDTLIDKVWILGGDPIDQDPKDLFTLVRGVVEGTGLPVWLFTRHKLFVDDGYLKEEYEPFYNAIHTAKYIKTGAYLPEQADENYWVNGIQLATANQRIWTQIAWRHYLSLSDPIQGTQPPWTGSAQWASFPARCDRAEFVMAANFHWLDRQRLHGDTTIETAITDPVQYTKFIQRIYQNDGYCPCKVKKTPQTICMCEEFRMMEEGVCHCGLFCKINKNNIPKETKV